MKNDAMKNAPAGENERPLMLAPAFKDYIWGGERLKRDWGKQTDLSPLAESWELSCHEAGAVRRRVRRMGGADARTGVGRAPAVCGHESRKGGRISAAHQAD